MSVIHMDGCCCSACLGGPQRSTSDTDTPTPPGSAGSTKPIYSRNQVIDALMTSDGGQNSGAWSSQTVTYSISTGPLSFGQQYWESEYNGYVAMDSGMQGVAAEAFELWDEIVAIDLVQTTANAGANITFNYSSATGNSTYAERSFSGSAPGNGAAFTITDSDLWFASSWWTHNQFSDLFAGSYGLLTYLHEIGHALGLNHPGSYNGSASYAADATHFQDTRAYTTMSYFNASTNGSGTDHIGSLGLSYAATPLLHDILALQEIYGADMTTRTGNTTYGFNSNAGRASFDFVMNPNPVVAIWDAGGIDKIDVSEWNTNQTVDLNQGAFSSVGLMTDNLAIAYGAVIESATTGDGSDQIIGNDAANVLTGNGGSDVLFGGDGADILFGGADADTLDGGMGADTVRFAGSAQGVIADLWQGLGINGDAAGDVYLGIEHASGSDHADQLIGDPFTANQLYGLGGSDVLIGNGGHDFMLGGDGNDSIFGGTGRDVMRGNAGADHIDGASEDDWIQYNDAPGGISLNLELGKGTRGHANGDTFVNIEHIRGSNFADTIIGSSGRNLILGEAGDDEIRTAGGNDVVWADEGNDLIIGSSFGETFYGGEGQDTIYGGGGNDWARYNDATSGVDVSLKDGTGTRGEALNDLLVDIEFVWGSEFADTLEGDDGVNQIRGGAGDDTIIGLKANDILQGYEGADTFVFHIDDGIDRINEFEIGADTIRITGISGFGDLTISTFQGDAAVAYDQGDVVILTGIAAAEVQASWFEFG